MANYVGAARSNYFRVKDEETFLAWVETLPGVSAQRDTPASLPPDAEDHPHPYYTLLADDTDGSGWPFQRVVEKTCGPKGCGQAGCGGGSPDEDCQEAREEDEEIDLPAELAEHLAEGQVAVLEEAGAQKLVYLFAHAVAVNEKGETMHLDLSDIYDRVEAAGWAEHVPPATY